MNLKNIKLLTDLKEIIIGEFYYNMVKVKQ